MKSLPPVSLSILLLPLLLLSCGYDGEYRMVRALEDTSVWERIEGGWARGVVLNQSLSLTPPPGMTAFRALAFPGDGEGGTLILNAGDRSWSVAGPTPVALDVDGPVTLSATGRLFLAVPRWTRGDPASRRTLLMVADALRRDHAGPDRMPKLHEWFAGGMVLGGVYSQSSWTLPSMASLFTGQLPVRLRTPDGTLISIPDDVETVAGTMASRGTITVGVVANYTLNHENGFSSGFDLYYVPTVLNHGESPDGAEVNQRALRAAEWFAEENLFLYLHYMEPHEPYRNHETGEVVHAVPTGTEVDPDRVEAMKTAYASEAAYLDGKVDELMEALQPFDLAVFTADHGEEFGDHGGFRHGPTLYDEVVRVPLMVRGKDLSQGRISRPVPLLNLGSFLRSGDFGDLTAPSTVTMETFSHATPRWAVLLGDFKVTLFARSLAGGANPDPIGRWLEENHPRHLVQDRETGDDIPHDPAVLRRAAGHLVRYYRGFRRGVFVAAPSGTETTLSISGADAGGLAWGDGEAVRIEPGKDGALEVTISRPDPFLLLHLPVPPEITPYKGEDRPLPNAPGAPFAGDGVEVWFDEGRPPAEVRGMEETLKRLKSLGYIQ